MLHPLPCASAVIVVPVSARTTHAQLSRHIQATSCSDACTNPVSCYAKTPMHAQQIGSLQAYIGASEPVGAMDQRHGR